MKNNNLNTQSVILYSFIFLFLVGCGGQTYFDDIALVAKDETKGDYGFVNLKGEVVLDFNFNKKPSIMHEGFSHFKNDEKQVVYIKEDGNDIKTPFSQTSLFNNGLALVTNDKGKLKYIDYDLKEVLTLDKSIEQAGYFFDDRAKIQSINGKWGFIDKTGAIVIKPIFDYVHSFSEGYAMVRIKKDDVDFRGIVDKDGNYVVDLDDDYKSLANFHDGLAAFSKQNERGYLNTNGEVVIKNKDWDRVFPFHEGYACVKENGDYGLINKKGERIIKPREETNLMLFNDLSSYMYVYQYGFINKDREEKVKADYQRALPFFNKGAYVKDGNEWIFINKKNKPQTNVELKRLYMEDFMENVYANTNPFDYDETWTTEYIDIDGILGTLFKRTGIDYFGVNKNDNGENALDHIIELYDAYPESKFNDGVDKEKIISKKLLNKKSLSSKSILGDYCKYDKNFKFSLIYNYDNKIFTKDQTGIKTNQLAKPSKITLYMGFSNRAKNENDFIESKIKDFFVDNGYVLNEETSQFESSGKPSVLINYITRSSAELIISFN